jgi:hypothetical protein
LICPYISERYENVVIMGGSNAHTGNQQERLIDNPDLPAGNGIPARVTHADESDARGELLLKLAADQDLVMTNSRKDGSRTSPSALLTYVNSAHRPSHKSLIDYVLLPPDLYWNCASHQNIFHYNHTIKTSHALVCVTQVVHRLRQEPIQRQRHTPQGDTTNRKSKKCSTNTHSKWMTRYALASLKPVTLASPSG